MERNNNSINNQKEDCLSCKIIGVSTFSGIGAYGSYLYFITPKNNSKNRLFYSIFTLTSFSLALFRLSDVKISNFKLF